MFVLETALGLANRGFLNRFRSFIKKNMPNTAYGKGFQLPITSLIWWDYLLDNAWSNIWTRYTTILHILNSWCGVIIRLFIESMLTGLGSLLDLILGHCCT